MARGHGSRCIPGEEILPQPTQPWKHKRNESHVRQFPFAHVQQQAEQETSPQHFKLSISKYQVNISSIKIISLACIGYDLPHSYKGKCNFMCLVSDCQLPKTGILHSQTQRPCSTCSMHRVYGHQGWVGVDIGC